MKILEELSQLGTLIKNIYKTEGINSDTFSEQADKYSRMILNIVPREMIQVYFGKEKIFNPTYTERFEYLGVLSYPVIQNGLEDNFKEKFNEEYDYKKYITVTLPTREENIAGGGYAVAVYKVLFD